MQEVLHLTYLRKFIFLHFAVRKRNIFSRPDYTVSENALQVALKFPLNNAQNYYTVYTICHRVQWSFIVYTLGDGHSIPDADLCIQYEQCSY